MLKKIEQAVSVLRDGIKAEPRVGLILGSGLGAFVDTIEVEQRIPFSEIPFAPTSSVVGHSGAFITGRVGSVPVAVMQGRVHFYEGYSMDEVLFLPRVLGRLGVRRVIVTNAAGGVNLSFAAGNLMLISDHVNLFGVNPLRGKNVDELGVRFPDMSDAYSAHLRSVSKGVAEGLGIDLREGVYFGLSGPTYETPAEIRMYRMLGADAVGMSTIPEVIALNHMAIECVGISCITNMAAGVLPQKLTHQEVMETTARVQGMFAKLLAGLIPAIDAA